MKIRDSWRQQQRREKKREWRHEIRPGSLSRVGSKKGGRSFFQGVQQKLTNGRQAPTTHTPYTFRTYRKALQDQLRGKYENWRSPTELQPARPMLREECAWTEAPLCSVRRISAGRSAESREGLPRNKMKRRGGALTAT